VKGDLNRCARISALLPVYNAASSLEAVVSSLRAQTLNDWECILVDDGSTDATAVLAAEMAADDARVRVVTNAANLGLPGALNRALFISRGEFLARLDGDDILEPERFERQLAFLQGHPEVDLVGTGGQLIEQGRKKAVVTMPPLLFGRDAATLKSSIVLHSSVMARRSFFENHGLYDSRFPRSEDRELWIRGPNRRRDDC
jgi:glycosyltransferase involved in cell wall biosynthesis